MPSFKPSLDSVLDSNLYHEHETYTCKQGIADDHTIKERRELELIEQGLVYDQTNNFWVVKYPWIKDPINLHNNLPTAVHRLKETEKRLSKLGPEHCRLYKEQINGPEFLKLPIKQWPVKQTTETELPDMIGRTSACGVESTVLHDDKTPIMDFFNLNRYSSYTKLLSHQ